MNAIWEEAGQLAILQTWSKSWSRVYDEETPARVSERNLNSDAPASTCKTATELLHQIDCNLLYYIYFRAFQQHAKFKP